MSNPSKAVPTNPLESKQGFDWARAMIAELDDRCQSSPLLPISDG
jgi:hypothetical protein